MRIESLYIKRFKNLVDFKISFDKESPTTVLVGRNATGKSNLLEALIIIFRDLDFGEPPSFCFKLVYLCRKRRVEIDADPERIKVKVYILVDGKAISYNKFSTDPERKYLPSNLFAYYSGPSNRMESHFEKHQERFYKDLLSNFDNPLRPLFYTRLVHSQFVLLSFFSADDVEASEFLDEHFGISSLESILFIFSKPPWNSDSGDPRFWNAGGVVKDFLSRLYELSLAPIRLSRRVKTDFRRSKTLEHLYLYIKDNATLKEIAKGYAKQEFFKVLESTYISEIISEVRIKVKIRNIDGSITFRELAEGEQQLLTVLGLLRFTQDDESLFLLDEPDTHLNPVWSIKYLDHIDRIAQPSNTSQIILATHDPLLISGLLKNQIRIMVRNEINWNISAEQPKDDPRGMGVAALLTSEIYGLRAALDLHTLDELDSLHRLMYKKPRTPAENKKYNNLSTKLANMQFSKSVSDPLYSLFLKEISQADKYKELLKPTLTQEEREELDRIASEIINKLLDEEKMP